MQRAPELLAIELDVLSFQHQTETTIAEPPPLGRQLSQLPAKPFWCWVGVAGAVGGHVVDELKLIHLKDEAIVVPYFLLRQCGQACSRNASY